MFFGIIDKQIKILNYFMSNKIVETVSLISKFNVNQTMKIKAKIRHKI